MSNKNLMSYGAILRMTIPVMFGMMAEFIVNIINTSFLSRVDGKSMVASGNAGLVYVTIMMVSYGIAGAAQIIMARRDGEKDYKNLSQVMWNSFLLIGIIHVFLFVILQLFSGPLFGLTVASPEIAEKMTSFTQIRSLGIFFSVLELGFFAYYTGTGKTLPVMFATIVQGSTNLLFDYTLIFGHFGFPAMGLEGAAWSTVISDGCSGFTYLLFFLLGNKQKEIRKFYRNKLDATQFIELLKLGWPLMGQGLVSVGSWVVFFFMIEHMGQEPIEISQTIRSFYYVALTSVLAFGTTSKTIVSKLMAEGKTAEVLPTLRRIILCSLACTFVVTHANFFYPHAAVKVINNNPAILDETVLTLRIVSLAMLMFAISNAFTNMVSGTGATRASFMIEFISILFYLIMAILVTVVFPQPIHLVWCIEYVYFTLMIVAAVYYIRKGKWKSIKI
jgi:putative MATE family efflux protein